MLNGEKELTRRSDELAKQRQALPWVRIDKDYRFDTDEGKASLADQDACSFCALIAQNCTVIAEFFTLISWRRKYA